MKSLVIFLSVVALACTSPVPQDESVLKLVLGNFVNCMNSDLNLCLKEHALRAANKLRSVRQLDIYDGVTILNNAPREAKSLDTLSDDLTVRKQQVTELLKDQALALLQNTELEISYGGEGEEEEPRALEDGEEGRSKKKKQIKNKLKMLMPLLLLLKAKAVVAAILSLVIIAVSVFKLAAIAKIAFLVKIISFIKMLLAKKNNDDHGWAPQEEHGHGHGGWESQGWGRSRNEAADLAYSAYKQH